MISSEMTETKPQVSPFLSKDSCNFSSINWILRASIMGGVSENQLSHNGGSDFWAFVAAGTGEADKC